MRPKTFLRALHMIPVLGCCSTILDRGLISDPANNGITDNTFSRRAGDTVLWHGEVVPSESVKRWASQKGAKVGQPGYIRPEKMGGAPELNIGGQWYPLIQLDCENTNKLSYKGNYHDVCRNYLWLR